MNEIIYVLFILSGAIKLLMDYFQLPMVMDFTILTALILIGLFIYDLYKNSFNIKSSSLQNYSLFFLIALFILILISFFYTTSEHYVYEKTLQFFTILLCFIFPLYIHNFSSEKFFKWFLIIMFIITITYLPLFIPAYKIYSTQYTAFLSNPLFAIFKAYLMMGYLFAIALLISSFTNTISNHIYRIIISIFFLGALMASGARGPLFSFILILILFLFYNRFKFKIPRIKTVVFLIIVFSVFASYSVMKLDLNTLFERTIDRIVNIRTNASALDRIVRADFVIDTIDAKHLFFGYGFGSFGQEFSGVDARSYPHNIILELLFELGVIGVILYLLFLLPIIRAVIKSRQFISSALFLYVTLNSLKSLSLSDSRVLFGFYSIILIIYLQKKSHRLSSNKEFI